MEKLLKKAVLVFILFICLQSGSAQNIKKLKIWLSSPAQSALDKQAFATNPLSLDEAKEVTQLLWVNEKDSIKKKLDGEWQKRVFEYKNYSLKFIYKVFGEKPKDGHSMYISLHGGGGAAPAVNEQQWQNQMVLYSPKEGVYVVPRSPTDTWNMWHQDYMDYFLDHLIRSAIVFADVNPNKVYILGYSAGGDGVYQLAPRMADHWAAASMMSGHPGDASTLNLRNLPFSIYAGNLDSAYNRNVLAKKWGNMLDSLQKKDPAGYVHDVHIYPDMPHWMSRRDTIAIPWMAKYLRNPLPEKVVWKQDDVLREYLYWLAVPSSCMKAGNEIIAEYKNNTINILKCDSDMVIINLNDLMMDLDKPITVLFKGEKIFKGKVKRTMLAMWQSIKTRGDANFIFSAQLKIEKGKMIK